MKLPRIHHLSKAVLVSICISMFSPAGAQSQGLSQTQGLTPSAPSFNSATFQPSTAMGTMAWAKPGSLFDDWFKTGNPAVVENPTPVAARPVDWAAPAPYPGGGSSSSTFDPTHFEIEGFAQWRNIMSSGSISTANNGNISLGADLGLGNMVAGPLFRFIWTPEKKIKGATSKIWVEYGQIDHSRTRSITGTITFGGRIYIVDSTLRTDLSTKQFEVGYAPRWGNDKFRIGPSVTYERLNVAFTLTDLTPGAPPPITQEVSVPNNVVLIGADFDYKPNQKFDLYGKLGVVPCCGGGWHILETEFGGKYYFTHHVSIMGGARYAYMRRDFDLPETTVVIGDESATIGPFHGSLKFPGIGPFVGMSYRF